MNFSILNLIDFAPFSRFQGKTPTAFFITTTAFLVTTNAFGKTRPPFSNTKL